MSGPNPPDHKGKIFLVRSRAAAPAGRSSSETDAYSQAYSAPESEQFTSGPYVPADSGLYEYDSYEPSEHVEPTEPPRWPWVVGVVAIVAAIALVVSVSVLVTRTDTSNLATPETTTSTPPPPPVQDEITTTTPPPPPPPPPPTEPPPPPPETVTVTQEPAPPPPPAARRGAAAAARDRTAAAADHDSRGATAGHVLGDRDQGAWRHHHGHLHRRLGPQPHAAQRLHSVVSDRDAHLAVRGGLCAGVQPVPGEQAQLLDHDQRWHGAVVEYQQLRTDGLLMPYTTDSASEPAGAPRP